MAKKSLQKQIERKHAGAFIFRQDFPEYHTEYVGTTLANMAERSRTLSRSVGKTLRGQGNRMIMISISGTAVVVD